MDNPQKILKDLNPEKEFFIGIDSDGCAFDTMEIKHKECFCPNFIKHFRLQRISKYAREAWEFVNLYSKTRGINRFKALIKAFELLPQRTEVQARNPEFIEVSPVKEWVEKETKLGNPALKKYASEVNNEIINLALRWSLEVNETVSEMVKDIPPFPYVRESLEWIKGKTDTIVVSGTPVGALEREWNEHSLDEYVRIIAGQEYGSKSEHLKYTASGKYDKNKVLMIGDAPGDFKAAKANNFLFYPIIPGNEEESWERLYKEASAKFFNGTYAGSYEDKLTKEFNVHLPEQPPWSSV